MSAAPSKMGFGYARTAENWWTQTPSPIRLSCCKNGGTSPKLKHGTKSKEVAAKKSYWSRNESRRSRDGTAVIVEPPFRFSTQSVAVVLRRLCTVQHARSGDRPLTPAHGL